MNAVPERERLQTNDAGARKEEKMGGWMDGKGVCSG